jgi:threonine dehydrogenase-like Zn-dependent dehydrogenase
MLAAVTERVGTMALVDRPEPPEPGPGEVVVAPEAVAVVERNGPFLAAMISHEFNLQQAPEAIRFAMSNPTEVMKVVIRGV